MTLENFKDIRDLTKKRCNISGITDFDDIISTALNNVYIELKKKEPAVAATIAVSVNGVASLPDDILDIIRLDPQLNSDEYRLGNNLILNRKEDTELKLIYTSIPEYLVNDDDVPELSKKYFYPLSTYGCYAYYNFKKKPEVAQTYLYEYEQSIWKLDAEDKTPTVIQNVYGGLY